MATLVSLTRCPAVWPRSAFIHPLGGVVSIFAPSKYNAVARFGEDAVVAGGEVDMVRVREEWMAR